MKDVLEKIRKGDPISDDELTSGIIHFTNLCNLLEPHGDLYHLTWKDAHSELLRLEAWVDYRRSQKKK